MRVSLEATFNPHNMLFGIQHMEGFIEDEEGIDHDTLIISLGFFGVVSIVFIKD